MPSQIHPTAIIDAQAQLADNVAIGPYSIISGEVKLGENCKVGPHCHIIGPITIGANNDIGTGVVLGERPQHLAADGNGADVFIGDGNSFREFVTVHRGSGPGMATIIGNNNYLMANSHVGHDCRVGNNCIFANSALLGGHATIDDKVFLSGNSAVHQRMHVGRLALVSGCAAASMNVPPFIIIQNVNQVCGVNVIGMKRAGFSSDQISAMRQVFRILYLQHNLIGVALERIEEQLGGIDVVREFLDFVRNSPKGISTFCGRTGKRAA